MKKLLVIISVLLFFLSVSAQQTTKKIEVEEFKYRPYKTSEFVFDSLATIVGVGMVAAISLGLGFQKTEPQEGYYNPAPLISIGVLNLVGPIVGSMGISISGALHKSQGNFFAGLAGGYIMAFPFLAIGLLFDNEMPAFMGLGTALMVPGIMIGYATSRKTRIYSARALMMNVFGTVLGGVSGMLTLLNIPDELWSDQSLSYAAPAVLLTVGGTFLTFLVSRYALVDEPDNAGTWIGVIGGTALGAITGFGIGALWKFNDNGDYERGAAISLVITGAILGELIGFVATHTKIPKRKIGQPIKKVTFNILPPMMVPERIPIVNKTIKRWMILNAGISF